MRTRIGSAHGMRRHARGSHVEASWGLRTVGLLLILALGVPGVFVGGWLSDRLGRRIVGLVAALLVGVGVVAAIGLGASAPALAVAGLGLHGIGTGATIAARSAAFGDVFGGPTFGTIFGLLAVAYPIGGSLAVYVGAITFDSTGSFALLVPVVLVAVAAWSASLWIAGPRRSRGTVVPSRSH